jgi:hypothetical protein
VRDAKARGTESPRGHAAPSDPDGGRGPAAGTPPRWRLRSTKRDVESAATAVARDPDRAVEPGPGAPPQPARRNPRSARRPT